MGAHVPHKAARMAASSAKYGKMEIQRTERRHIGLHRMGNPATGLCNRKKRRSMAGGIAGCMYKSPFALQKFVGEKLLSHAGLSIRGEVASGFGLPCRLEHCPTDVRDQQSRRRWVERHPAHTVRGQEVGWA